MACFCLYNSNVCIHCFFVVFAPNLMIPPNVFDDKDGFARRHGIRTSRHSLIPGWELTCKITPIPYWHFGNSTSTSEMTKLRTFLALIR